MENIQRAIARASKEEVTYKTTETSTIEVTYPSGIVKEYAASSFQTLFHRLQDKPVAAREYRPAYYEHKYSALGLSIKMTGGIEFPFPENISEYLQSIALKFKAVPTHILDKRFLKGWYSQQSLQFVKQLRKCEDCVANLKIYQSLPQDDFIAMKVEENTLWAKDHFIRACAAYVEMRDTRALLEDEYLFPKEEIIPSIPEEKELNVKPGPRPKDKPMDVEETRRILSQIMAGSKDNVERGGFDE